LEFKGSFRSASMKTI